MSNIVELAGSVGRFERFEADISLSRSYVDPFDSDAIKVDVTFTAPSGATSKMSALGFEDFGGARRHAGNDDYWGPESPVAVTVHPNVTTTADDILILRRHYASITGIVRDSITHDPIEGIPVFDAFYGSGSIYSDLGSGRPLHPRARPTRDP